MVSLLRLPLSSWIAGASEFRIEEKRTGDLASETTASLSGFAMDFWILSAVAHCVSTSRTEDPRLGSWCEARVARTIGSLKAKESIARTVTRAASCFLLCDAIAEELVSAAAAVGILE